MDGKIMKGIKFSKLLSFSLVLVAIIIMVSIGTVKVHAAGVSHFTPITSDPTSIQLDDRTMEEADAKTFAESHITNSGTEYVVFGMREAGMYDYYKVLKYSNGSYVETKEKFVATNTPGGESDIISDMAGGATYYIIGTYRSATLTHVEATNEIKSITLIDNDVDPSVVGKYITDNLSLSAGDNLIANYSAQYNTYIGFSDPTSTFAQYLSDWESVRSSRGKIYILGTYSNTHVHNSGAYGSNGTHHWTKCTDDEGYNGVPVAHTWSNGVCSVCSYTCTHSGATTGTCSICGKDLGSTPPPAPTPTPDPAPAESAPEPVPEMTTINIDGATFNSWEEITANTPALTADKLKKVNESDDDLLHVNIVGKEDKTVPAEAVKAMDKSTITGLHVFIGESDAVTFLNNLDYSKYTGMNFKHEDEVTETGRTIDFTSKGKLNAVLVFHTLIAPNTKANVYKVVDGKEVFLATLQSNENGGFCFAIDELAKYVIKY